MGLQKVKLLVGKKKVEREFLINIPEGLDITQPVGGLIIYHGHSSTDSAMAKKGYHLQAPFDKIITIYPQGLATPRGEGDDSKDAGWQRNLDEVNPYTGMKNQDLKFFDAIIAYLDTNFTLDRKKLYLHGWSNGGMLVYNVLWRVYTTMFAGICVAAALLDKSASSLRYPTRVAHIAGLSDDKVGFPAQEGKTLPELLQLNKCTGTKELFATDTLNSVKATRYFSELGKDVLFIQYAGEHAYPDNIVKIAVQFLTL